MTNKNINWDASSFFERLASKNKLAKTEEFRFCRVSGLEGFEEAIQHLQSTANSIGVCYIGRCTADNKRPKDTRTPEQKLALLELLKHLKQQYPSAIIRGHRDYAPKACLSFDATSMRTSKTSLHEMILSLFPFTA